MVLEVAGTVEGAGTASLETEGETLTDAATTWQSVVDVSSTVAGGASVKSVSTRLLDELEDHVELTLLGTGDAGVPDFATWHPVLAPVAEGLADIALDMSSDATLRMVAGRDKFLQVQVGPALIASPSGDAAWNQVVIDHLNGAAAS